MLALADLREAVAAAKMHAKKRRTDGQAEDAHDEHGKGHDHDKGHEHGGHEHGGDEHGKGNEHGKGHEHHGHEHGNGHEHDKGHEHGGFYSNDHSHGERPETSAALKYGITSFVYTRRRPFHPQRLLDAVLQLPVKEDPDSGDLADDWELPDVTAAATGDELVKTDKGTPSVMRAIIRSKGFVWIANQVT